MGSIAAYTTTVKRGGTSTAMSDEAMTNTTGNTYQLNNTAKRILDRTVTPTFKANGVAVDPGDISSIDYLFGKVTFVGAESTPITLDTGSYIPTIAIAGAHAHNLTMTADILDRTDFDGAQSNGGFRQKLYGLRDVTVNVSRWAEADQTFFTALNAKTPVLIEIRPGGANDFARGWFLISTENHSGDITALEASDPIFVLDGEAEGAFNWGT